MNPYAQNTSESRIFGAFTLTRPMQPNESLPPALDTNAVNVSIDVFQDTDGEEVRQTIVATAMCAPGWTPGGQSGRLKRSSHRPEAVLIQSGN